MKYGQQTIKQRNIKIHIDGIRINYTTERELINRIELMLLTVTCSFRRPILK